MSVPSHEEVWAFLSQESKPYKFEYVKAVQPLRISIERKTIYVNKRVLMNSIRSLVADGLDWKEIMRKDLMHEKAHELYFKWNVKWNIPAIKYGWLTSFLIDFVIDKVHFRENARYQKLLLLDSCRAFKTMKNHLWNRFPLIDTRPHSLYNQAAYWVAIGATRLSEAVDLYPEKADYIVELSELFRQIKSEKDLGWAFLHAKKIYFEMIASQQS